MNMDAQTLLEKRDAKAKPHLEQYAPVWIVNENVLPHEDAVQFDVLFQHGLYGWVKRRYRYDGFNNVLYYRGQTVVTEEETFAYQDKKAYIPALVADVVNSYGG